MKLQNPSLRKRKGFTLIELIVVIAILAILAAIAVPTFLNSLNRARWNSDVATARVIASSYMVYLAEGNAPITTTPQTITELKGADAGTNEAKFMAYLENVQEPQYNTDATDWSITFGANSITSIADDNDPATVFYPSTAFPG